MIEARPGIEVCARPRGVVAGAALLGEAASLLRRQPSLWMLAVIPISFTVAGAAGALALVIGNLDWLQQLTTAWLPQPEATSWLSWLWVGPALLGLWLVARLLQLLLAAAVVALALLAATVLAAPFLDALSQRIEAIETCAAAPVRARRGVVAEGLASIGNEARRMAFFVALWLAIWLVCAAIPGGAAVAVPLLALLTIFFLPLDYAGYALDRRGVAFRERRSWLRANWPVMMGFGSGAFAIGLVPGLNLVLLPLLVVGGTLLALRLPIEALSSVGVPAQENSRRA